MSDYIGYQRRRSGVGPLAFIAVCIIGNAIDNAKANSAMAPQKAKTGKPAPAQISKKEMMSMSMIADLKIKPNKNIFGKR